MGRNKVIVKTLFVVLSIQVYVAGQGTLPLQNNVTQDKRLDDEKTVTSTQSSEEENPCNRPDPETPDFSAPGRRLAEIKCYEYIWNIQYRIQKAENDKACAEYIRRNKTTPLPPFIIGGRLALPGEFPHMAAIGWKAVKGTWIYKCGGTLISPRFVLTAAHCTKTAKGDELEDPVPQIVRLGDKNIIDTFDNDLPAININISRIIVHPQYKSPIQYYDVALLELAEEVRFHYNTQPACLWTKFDTSSLGNNATVTGWGVVNAATRKTSPKLQAAVVNIIDSTKCGELLNFCNRKWCGVKEHQLCAGILTGGVDACQGDSGGPLQVKIPLPITSEGAMHYVIGVTQLGFGCGHTDRPGIYSRVSSFVDWIEGVLNAQPVRSAVEEDPCKRPYPQLPNFTAPGRRISEVKCYEYIWELKKREELSKRDKAKCPNYTRTVFIIGGRNALPGEFPHMAGIGWKAVQGTWVFYCGGTLISPKFVLTAAHCSRASSRDTTLADPVPKIVRLGDKNIVDAWINFIKPKDVNISRIIVHPQFKPPKKYFDIALLELQRELEFDDNLQPACLWTKADTSQLGTKATLTGWGVIHSAGHKTSPILQAAVVDIIDSQQCNELLQPTCDRNWCGLQEQICAGVLEGGVDSCQGDSGGPLQVKIPLPISSQGAMHYVIGVTQFGYGCGIADRPGVYSRVSSFIDWIESIVWT